MITMIIIVLLFGAIASSMWLAYRTGKHDRYRELVNDYRKAAEDVGRLEIIIEALKEGLREKEEGGDNETCKNDERRSEERDKMM